jgi:hypothetical protein
VNKEPEAKPLPISQPPAQVIKPGSISSAEAFGTPTILKSFPHWRYFLALEADLESTTRYVEPTRNNFPTYSIEFAHILLTVGSEVDVVAQALCRQVDPVSPASNIQEYRKKICSTFPRFPTMRVLVPRFALLFEPWREWDRMKTPLWWQSHNKIKHERDTHFPEASLENAFTAVAALFCLVLYLYQRALYSNELNPWTRLLTLEKEPGYLMLEQNYELPDFPATK